MPGAIGSIVLKLVTPCNLNCRYCYIYHHQDTGFRHRPPFISDQVFGAALSAIRRYCVRRRRHRIAITFHGGEPTLVGADRFNRLAGTTRGRLGPYLGGLSIQTNGTLIDDAWVKVLRRHAVRVGISLDGTSEVNDAVRIDHRGRGTHARALAGLRRLQDAGLDPSILCVIQPDSSGVETYRYFRRLGLTRMDFLLPDVSHDSKALRYGSGGTPLADYLIPVFDAWFDEDDPEVDVRIFGSLLRLLLGGDAETDGFGNPLMGYLVVETDGSIEALDALRVCEDGIARTGLNVLDHGFDDLESGLPLAHRLVHEGIPLSAKCQRCEEREVCGGGYVPHRFSHVNGFDNPSVWCADILSLLSHMRRRIGDVAH